MSYNISTFKVQKFNNFKISIDALRSNLEWEAKGVMSYLLTATVETIDKETI